MQSHYGRKTKMQLNSFLILLFILLKVSYCTIQTKVFPKTVFICLIRQALSIFLQSKHMQFFRKSMAGWHMRNQSVNQFSNNVTDITNKRILGIFGKVPLVQEFSFLLKTRTVFGCFQYSEGWIRPGQTLNLIPCKCT